MGIWPNSFWYIRILFPYGGLFYEPALSHDKKYTEWWTETDRNIADSIFYSECLLKSKNNLQIFVGFIYYLLVREFWFLYFTYK